MSSQKKVAEHYDIRLADMTSKRARKTSAFPGRCDVSSRQNDRKLAQHHWQAFGGRDHGTVLHACRLVKDRMQIDSNVRQVVSYLEKQLMR